MEPLEKKIKLLQSKLDDLKASSISRRELNKFQLHIDDQFKKLHKKISDMSTITKNSLLKISTLAKEKDDFNEIMAQMDLLKNKRESGNEAQGQ